MSKPPKNPTHVYYRYICYRRLIFPDLYSEENKKQQEKIIYKFEKSLNYYNCKISDCTVGDETLLFHSMAEFAHPIFIKYLKEKFADIIKTIPNFEYEIKQLFDFLYIKIHYNIIKSSDMYGLTLMDYQAILDEYSSMFNISYEKKTYD
jgi:hypothetical protein